MTVLKLQSGGLWIHAPVAPTRQVSHPARFLAACAGNTASYRNASLLMLEFSFVHKIGCQVPQTYACYSHTVWQVAAMLKLSGSTHSGAEQLLSDTL